MFLPSSSASEVSTTVCALLINMFIMKKRTLMMRIFTSETQFANESRRCNQMFLRNFLKFYDPSPPSQPPLPLVETLLQFFWGLFTTGVTVMFIAWSWSSFSVERCKPQVWERSPFLGELAHHDWRHCRRTGQLPHTDTLHRPVLHTSYHDKKKMIIW